MYILLTCMHAEGRGRLGQGYSKNYLIICLGKCTMKCIFGVTLAPRVTPDK